MQVNTFKINETSTRVRTTIYLTNWKLVRQYVYIKDKCTIFSTMSGISHYILLFFSQVKVWFQNRRTKHKRVKSEEGDGVHSVTSPCSDDEIRESDCDLSDFEETNHMICNS